VLPYFIDGLYLLLIAGIATQTILTIPLNSVTNNQMVNMAMGNGQVMSTSLASLAHQFNNNNGEYFQRFKVALEMP
jgi:hypothetical protein